LVKGPNIASFPQFEPHPDDLEIPVLLKVGDEISTDTIMPAGAKVLPFRSNIPEISRFVYASVDESYSRRASESKDMGGHAIIAGKTYGQGSSREHAALAPRYLGLRTVIAKNFARIHWQNLVDFGILPLRFENDADYDDVELNDRLKLSAVRDQLRKGKKVVLEDLTKKRTIVALHDLSTRQVDVLLAGGLINWMKSRTKSQAARRWS
jgi:aconitate hydratase